MEDHGTKVTSKPWSRVEMSKNHAVQNLEDTGVTRPPPEIRRLLPPLGKQIAWGYVLAFIFVVTFTGIQFGRTAPAFKLAWAIVFSGIGVTAVFAAALQRKKIRAFNKRRAAFAKRFPDAIDCARTWNNVEAACSAPLFIRPRAFSIATLLGEDANSDCAMVLCAGLIDEPNVPRDAFEPEIITPSRHQLGYIMIAITMIVGFSWIGQQVWTGEIPFTGPNGPKLVVMGLGAAVLVITATNQLVFRSTFVRLAPGMIQFMSFGILNRKPKIRSYPREAGTIMVFGDFGRFSRWFLIARENQADSINLSGTLRSRDGLNWLWRTLLCPSPTPPLSDDALLG